MIIKPKDFKLNNDRLFLLVGIVHQPTFRSRARVSYDLSFQDDFTVIGVPNVQPIKRTFSHAES